MNTLRLGRSVTDSATQLPGMLTHLRVQMDRSELYLFQPRGLNPETGQPVKGMWIDRTRILGGVTRDIALPLEVLGTQVADSASGFEGTVICLTLHINGCVHGEVQPVGTQPKSGSAIESCDFDIRRLLGAALKPLTIEEQDADEVARPSPASVVSSTPRLPC